MLQRITPAIEITALLLAAAYAAGRFWTEGYYVRFDVAVGELGFGIEDFAFSAVDWWGTAGTLPIALFAYARWHAHRSRDVAGRWEGFRSSLIDATPPVARWVVGFLFWLPAWLLFLLWILLWMVVEIVTENRPYALIAAAVRLMVGAVALAFGAWVITVRRLDSLGPRVAWTASVAWISLVVAPWLGGALTAERDKFSDRDYVLMVANPDSSVSLNHPVQLLSASDSTYIAWDPCSGATIRVAANGLSLLRGDPHGGKCAYDPWWMPLAK